ncbi:MAG: class I SAM-dependent methyltransferase [Mycolicibacterium sp.]
MSEQDRVRWDRRYAESPAVSIDEVALPAVFAGFADVFPTCGRGLDLACGRGGVAVWLAQRGVDVCGFDVSPVAITQARALADRCGVSGRCHFEVVDLDQGLPRVPQVDVLICNKFRDARLDRPIADRLAPGGRLAISALRAVGPATGSFRVSVAELRRAFDGLAVIAAGETDGTAWLLARRGQAR